ALRAIQACADVERARVADVAESGALKIVVAGPPVAPTERIAREGALRAEVLSALRAAGVPRAGMEAA
ncbi:MAG TPA: hypothetical protein VLB47_06315, partial [Solirubrobacteraceae bacterium]|nr:hypothetical protein [Solirubrobacteraceae bacterium]